MTEKAIVLIDCGYFDIVNRYAQDTMGKKISFEKLSKKATEEMTHIRTKIYHAPPYQPPNPTDEDKEKYRKAQNFFKAINRIPRHEFVPVGRVRLEKIYCSKCKENFFLPKQKGVDVAIAVDLVKMAQRRDADVFILICGDEDLSDAVAMAQQGPCNVIVYYCHDSSYNMYGSIKLRDTASNRVQMDLKFLEECAID